MAVYLIHFERRLHHAQHYVGYTDNLKRRFSEHRRGNNSSPLLAAARAAGIAWRIVRVWPKAGRDLERAIKQSHHTARYCPECNALVEVELDLPKYATDVMRWVFSQPGDPSNPPKN